MDEIMKMKGLLKLLAYFMKSNFLHYSQEFLLGIGNSVFFVDFNNGVYIF